MQAEYGTSVAFKVDRHSIGMNGFHVLTSSISVTVVKLLPNLERSEELRDNALWTDAPHHQQSIDVLII